MNKRNWINKNFVDLKKNNPDLMLIVRECENAESNIIARYGKEFIFYLNSI